MTIVGAYEAKTHLGQLLDRVKRGERITITRHGVPVAILTPVDGEGREDVRQVIEKLEKFSRGRKLGPNLTIRDLIEEGRRY
jgi:prevent-host-death family protein